MDIQSKIQEWFATLTLDENKEVGANSAQRQAGNFPTLLLLNVNGEDRRTKLKKLLQEVMDSTLADIMLLIEPQWVDFRVHVPVEVTGRKYKYNGVVGQCGVLYDETSFDFELLDLNYNSDIPPHLVKRLIAGRFVPKEDSTFGHSSSFIVLCYHGPHNRATNIDKRRDVESVLKLAESLRSTKNWTDLPVLVGGDWNFNILTDKKIVLPKRAIVPSYNPVRRFDNFIDWFCLILPVEINRFKYCELADVTAAEFFNDEGKLNVNSFTKAQTETIGTDHDLTLDHDPIIGVFRTQLL